jgi:hypothetical protein
MPLMNPWLRQHLKDFDYFGFLNKGAYALLEDQTLLAI